MEDFVKNVKSIEISYATKELLSLRAELSVLYEHLAKVLNDIDPRDSNPKSRELLDVFLKADEELMSYISENIGETVLETDYKFI